MTAEVKQPAKASHHRMRESLREMAARGTEHEAQIAQEKLQILEAKYDFSVVGGGGERDWFEEWPKVQNSAQLHSVLEVDPSWMDAGNVVKWVFGARLNLPTKWKNRNQKPSLSVGVSLQDAAKLRPLAERLFLHVAQVCEDFYCSIGRPGASELERAPFMDGVTDGLSGEVRRPGRMTPGRSPHPPPKKRVRRVRPASAPAPLSVGSAPPPPRFTVIHPYDIGWEIGRRIRFNEDLPNLLEAVREALQAPDGEAENAA